MKTILVVNINWLGDAVFSSPVFTALKEANPGCRIICLAEPRIRCVLEHIPSVDEIIEYEEKGRHKGFMAKFAIIQAIRRAKCNEAYFIHGSNTKSLLVMLAGVKIRVGCPIKKKQQFLTHCYKPSENAQHRRDHYLDAIRQHGIAVKDDRARLTVSEADKKKTAQRFLDAGVECEDKVIGLNIGANWELKRWAVRNFKTLIDQLLTKNWKIVVTGASKDQEEVDIMLKGFNARNLINWTGKTSLNELIAVLDRCDVFVCADSGPLHLANALGTSVVGLFGPTRPEITGPVGTGRVKMLQHDVGCNRRPCYYEQCPDNICMQAVSVAEVYRAVEGLIHEG